MTACGGREPEEVPAGTFTIGYDAERTGPLAERDRVILETARIAVAEINRLGGIDRRLRLVLRRRRERVQAFLLPCDPSAQRALAAALPRRAIALAPCSGDPATARRFRFYVPVSVDADTQAAQLVDYLRAQGYERAHVIRAERPRYSRLLEEAFERAARARGIAIVAGLEKQADVIVTALFPPRAATLVRRLRDTRVTTPIAGMDPLDSRRVVEEAPDGAVFTAFGFPEPGLETDELYEKYRARFGHRPDGSYAALGYDAVKVLEWAIGEADSVDPNAIVAALDGLEVHGALGELRYPSDRRGAPEAEVAVVAVEDGELALVEKDVPEPLREP